MNQEKDAGLENSVTNQTRSGLKYSRYILPAEVIMKIKSSLRRASLVAPAMLGAALLAAFPLRPAAQEDVLLSSNPDLRALRSQRTALEAFHLFPRLYATSPDGQALKVLDEAASSAQGELRAAIDLLAVYESLQCEPDRSIVRPLLDDRLRLYSLLLDGDAKMAAGPLGIPGALKLSENRRDAAKLRDDLLAAKNKLDLIAASLK